MNAELLKEVSRDGRRIAVLRCFDDAEGETVVEAQIHREGIAPAERSYRFASSPEAVRFVQESLLALQYLGCNVA
jgi:hypothetical protein